VIGELGDALAEVLDPDTGEPLFASVHAAEDLYHGPALAYAPDVILDSYHKGWNIQTGRFTPVLEPSRHQYFVGNQREHGWHSREGICVFRGPSFNVGVPLMAGHVMDVPATLLHLYGVSLPDDYDGRVLTEVFAPEFIDRHPVTHQPGDAAAALPGDAVYSSDEADEISGHLKALGYIE
jgi:predicted AlkP superfamily phosphohydrolase/phosphomutase